MRSRRGGWDASEAYMSHAGAVAGLSSGIAATKAVGEKHSISSNSPPPGIERIFQTLSEKKGLREQERDNLQSHLTEIETTLRVLDSDVFHTNDRFTALSTAQGIQDITGKLTAKKSVLTRHAEQAATEIEELNTTLEILVTYIDKRLANSRQGEQHG